MEKFKNYGIWFALISGAVLLMQALGYNTSLQYVDDILCALSGLLVMLGIISNHGDKKIEDSLQDDNNDTENKD